jgi:hypothetical protein
MPQGTFLVAGFLNPALGTKSRGTRMDDDHPSLGGSFEFLRPHQTDSKLFLLSSGISVSIPKYILHFDPWKGPPIPNTYNGKAVIDWNGEPVFAELALLRLFQSHGWNGVWVDSYRSKYRVGLLDVAEPVALPKKQQHIIETIGARTGSRRGCWDVFVWKGSMIRFIELKRSKRDKVRETQVQWLEAALACDFKPEHFALIEWDL